MTKLSYTAVIVVMALGICFLFYGRMKVDDIPEADVYESKLFDGEAQILLNNSQLQWMFEGTSLNKDIIVQTEDSKQIPLWKIVGNGKKIIFRFSDRNCMACIEAQMALINKYKGSSQGRDLLFLVSANVKRDMLIKRQQFDIEYPIYFVDNTMNEVGLERYNIPYYFVMDKSCVMDLVFIPAKEIPLLTENYFSILGSKFKSKTSAEPTSL